MAVRNGSDIKADTLTGTSSADTIQGNGYNDRLYGYSGDDTYIFNIGDGQDIIYESSGNDKIQFGTGITRDNLTFSRSGYNLIISIGVTDKITVSNWFLGLSYQVENITFVDDETPATLPLTKNEILDRITYSGTYRSETIKGTNEKDKLQGYGGKDSIYGYAGDDTYIYSAGDGADKIIESSGNDTIKLTDLTFDQLTFNKSGNNLVIRTNISTDSLTIYNFYASTGYQVENIIFDTDIAHNLIGKASVLNEVTISGGSSLPAITETIYASKENDIIDAGIGKDYIYDYGGDDNYYYSSGDGTDIIYESLGNDTLNFADLNADQVTFSKSGNHLVLKTPNNTDKITFYNFYSGSKYQIENINFASGTDLIGKQAILEQVTITGNSNTLAETIYGSNENDTIDAGLGKDAIYGYNGDDIYYYTSGDGTDTIIETSGNDTLNFTDLVKADFKFEKSGNNLVIINKNNIADKITISNFYLGSKYQVENIIFSDSSTIDKQGILNEVTITGKTSSTETIYGSAENDIINAGSGNDVIYGYGGNDTYYFSIGNGKDTIIDASGTDKIVFTGNISKDCLDFIRSGNDLIIKYTSVFPIPQITDQITIKNWNTVNNRIEQISFSNGDTIQSIGEIITILTRNDSLTGSTGNDILCSHLGNDTINGGSGKDTMYGGLGDDTYIVDNTDDEIIEICAEGIDTVQSSISYTLGNTNVENLILTDTDNITGIGNVLHNTIIGNSGNNILSGAIIVDVEENGIYLTGIDTLIGGDGDDTYYVYNSNDIVNENSSTGNDTVYSSVSYTLSNGIENLILRSGATKGIGNSLNNNITGNSKDNILDGSSGADTLTGNDGNDTYYIDNSDDLVQETGTGIDTVISNISYTLGANIENLTLTGTDSINGIGNELNNTIIGNSGNNTLSGGLGSDTMKGGNGNDTYYIDDSNDIVDESISTGIDCVFSSISYSLTVNVENLTLQSGTSDINGYGNVLNNTIIGNSGNNILDGGSGIDKLIGGDGDDTYYINNTGDVIQELGTGVDTVISSISYTLGNNLENLTITGSNNINATGNDVNNTIVGNSGDNTLDGGLSADILIGGAGNDTYYVNDLDYISENTGDGIDTVYSSVSYTLGDNIETLILTSDGTIGVGNNQDNSIVAYYKAGLTLDGAGGNDTIQGNDYNDVIIGGSGNDSLYGGQGNDTYIFDDGFGLDTLCDPYGYNVIDFSRLDSEHNLTIDLTGTSWGYDDSNSITLQSIVVNTYYTYPKVSELILGAGNDTVRFGHSSTSSFDYYNVSTIVGGEGIDTLDCSSFSGSPGTLHVNLQGGYVYSNNSSYVSIVHTDIFGFENVIGGSGNDIITGNGEDNVLNGEIGNDELIGGAGNDTYIVDNVSDVVTETAGQGTDTIISTAASYTLAAGSYVEYLKLDIGSANLNIRGNELTNTIIGNDGNNILNGGVGADSMSGGDGNDTYIVDNAGDIVTESGTGVDQVQSSISFVLGANLENLFLTGSDSINGTGNSLNNSIQGNTGNNILDGGINTSGADTLVGLAGNDTYYIRNAGDTIIESTGQGTDSLTSFINSYTLGTGVSVEYLNIDSSVGSSTLIGNDVANTITGNANDNVLDGGSGIDYLDGGNGNDIYIIDNINDVVREINANTITGGIDTILSSVSYLLSANIENITLSGAYSINATGNYLNNTITGNSGNNILAGGEGNDTYKFDANWGNDTISDVTINNILDFSSINNHYVVVDLNNNLIKQDNTIDNTITLLQQTVADNNGNLDLNNLSKNNSIRFIGRNAGDGLGVYVSNTGDINGDGYDDILLVNAKDGDSGEVDFIFGRSDFDWNTLTDSDGNFNLDNMTKTRNTLKLSTQVWGDHINCVTNAGDVNGDGIDDVLLGTSYVSAGREWGKIYLILGRSNANWNSLTDTNGNFILENLTKSNNVIEFTTTDYFSQYGSYISNAGDVNGDGINDILIGAANDHDTEQNIGNAYLVFGRSNTEWGNLTDINGNINFDNLVKSNGVVKFMGQNDSEYTGWSVNNAGDVNGDGIDDVLISAYAAESGSGEVYLVFGRSNTEWNNLTNINGNFIIDNFTQSNNIIRFIGKTYNELGWDISNAGDVNGDGFDDILISDGQYGKNYLIFGRSNNAWNTLTGSNGNFSLSGFSKSNNIIEFLPGEDNYDTVYSITNAGDVNGDGFDDILMGVPSAGGVVQESTWIGGAGETYLLFGRSSNDWNNLTDINGNFSLANLSQANNTIRFIGRNPGQDSQIVEETFGDNAGISVSNAGDVNGDGFDDILIGAPSADGGGLGSGEAYIVFGKSNWYDSSSISVVIGSQGNDSIIGNGYNNEIWGNQGNDTLEGGLGDDSYHFKLGDGQDTVNDSGGTLDKVVFDSSVDKTKITLFIDGSNNLIIDYGTVSGNDTITVQSQNTNTIEKLELSDGKYLTDININNIISYISTFDIDSGTEGLQIAQSVNDVKANTDLMAYISSQWHT